MIKGLKLAWNGRKYDRLHHNCCHFSEELAKALGVGPIPLGVHHLADVGEKLDKKMKDVIHKLHVVEDRLLLHKRDAEVDVSHSDGS